MYNIIRLLLGLFIACFLAVLGLLIGLFITWFLAALGLLIALFIPCFLAVYVSIKLNKKIQKPPKIHTQYHTTTFQLNEHLHTKLKITCSLTKKSMDEFSRLAIIDKINQVKLCPSPSLIKKE